MRPLIHCQVRAGRVVAAAVQQHCIARLNIGQISHQPIKINAPGGGVEVAVFGHRHAKVFDDRRMVRPSGVRQPDSGGGGGQLDQLQRLTNGAGTAGSCDGGGAILIPVAQNHLHHGGVISRFARKAGVGLSFLGFPQLFLGGLHGAHHRGQAGCVLVNANAKVNFIRARIVTVHGDQLQDFVLRLRVQGFQHSSAFLNGKIIIHAPFGPRAVIKRMVFVPHAFQRKRQNRRCHARPTRGDGGF